MAYFSTPESESSLPDDGRPGTLQVTVQGAPAGVVTPIGDHTIQVTFGPIDANMFSVISSELSVDETLAFAESAILDADVPVITDAAVLHEMKPIGSIANFGAVYALVTTVINPVQAQAGVVTTQYGPEGARFTVSSQTAADEDLGVLDFFLGRGANASVRGRPALTFEVDASESLLAFGAEVGSLVAWVEGGRLVMVTGKLPVDELITLAETVRPATHDEWTEVMRVAANTANAAAD